MRCSRISGRVAPRCQCDAAKPARRYGGLPRDHLESVLMSLTRSATARFASRRRRAAVWHVRSAPPARGSVPNHVAAEIVEQILARPHATLWLASGSIGCPRGSWHGEPLANLTPSADRGCVRILGSAMKGAGFGISAGGRWTVSDCRPGLPAFRKLADEGLGATLAPVTARPDDENSLPTPWCRSHRERREALDAAHY